MSQVLAKVMKRVFWALNFLVFLCTMAHSIPLSYAQQIDSVKEHKIKAAFLPNFPKFFRWPEGTLPDNQEKFSVCILGEDPLNTSLSAIEGKTIETRTIELLYPDSLDQVSDCNMLYVGRSEKNSIDTLDDVLENSAVLTVSDINKFAESGGIIEFIITDNNKVSFRINLKKAREKGFEVDASLLTIAADIIL